MKIQKICEQYYKLCKFSGNYYSSDIEDVIKTNKYHEYDEFLNILHKLYQIHDSMYNMIGNISYDKEDERILNTIDNIKEYLPIVFKVANKHWEKSHWYITKMENLIEEANRVYNKYFSIFPKETRIGSLEAFIYTLSDFQNRLHNLLDRLFRLLPE